MEFPIEPYVRVLENDKPVEKKLKEIIGDPKYDMGCSCDNCVHRDLSDWTILRDNPCHTCHKLGNYLYIHKRDK